MLSPFKLLSLVAIIPTTLACLGYTGGLPTATSAKSNRKIIEVAAGAPLDGGWAKYDRGSGACNDQLQGEGGDSEAVFLLYSGATFQNVIIGKNQAEGVHCSGPCTLKFVWFEDETWIIGDGGAYHAADKVVQRNGCGTVNIINFYVENYGKLYRSCENCSSQCKRNVYIEGTTAVDGGETRGYKF